MLAQQLIDASKDGGAAFIAFATMVFLFAGSLFYMDHIRRKRDQFRGRLAILLRIPSAEAEIDTHVAAVGPA